MEESKELQGFYKIFRAVIYVSVLMEFFEYAIDPSPMGSIVCDLHSRIKQWMIYQDGNMAYSKIATFLLVCITCVGTRNKKHLEFDARKQVLYPLVSGVGFIVLSVWLFNTPMEMQVYMFSLNTLLYMATSIIGVVLVHIALDNISKFLKEGLLKDRFNFENESFEQCKDLQTNDYSVNIPMRYYYKGKFRKGWVNIVNPFRGRRRTNRAISVKLIYWLKLNVNNLKSAIWVKQRKITENIRKGMTSGWLGTSVGNYRFCFPEFPTNLRTPNGLNSIILSQFGMCK